MKVTNKIKKQIIKIVIVKKKNKNKKRIQIVKMIINHKLKIIIFN